MEFRIDNQELRTAVNRALADALGDHLDPDRPLAVDEGSAARLLGLARHQLRDLRLKGEIHPRKAGRSHLYSKQCLLEFLNQNLDQ